jgi:hypothetical protein
MISHIINVDQEHYPINFPTLKILHQLISPTLNDCSPQLPLPNSGTYLIIIPTVPNFAFLTI